MGEEILGMKNRKSAVSLAPSLSDTTAGGKKPKLSPEIQARIGQQLGKIYDDLVSQGVPNRFLILLERLESSDKDDGEQR